MQSLRSDQLGVLNEKSLEFHNDVESLNRKAAIEVRQDPSIREIRHRPVNSAIQVLEGSRVISPKLSSTPSPSMQW